MIKGGSIRMEKNLKHTVLDIGDWKVNINIIYTSNIYLYIFIFTDAELGKGELEDVSVELIDVCMYV